MASYKKPNYMNNNQFIPEFNSLNFIEPNDTTIGGTSNINLNDLDNRYLKKISNDSTSFQIGVSDLNVQNSGTFDYINTNSIDTTNNLFVGGKITFMSDLFVNTKLTCMSDLYVDNNLLVKNNLTITGQSTLNNNTVLNGLNSYDVDTTINNKLNTPEINAKWTYINKPFTTDTGASSFIAKAISNYNDTAPLSYSTNRLFYILQWELPANGVGLNMCQTISIQIDYVMSQNEVVAPEYGFCEMGTLYIQHMKQYNGVDSSPTGYYNSTNHQKNNIGYRGTANFVLYHETTQSSANKYCILFRASGGGSDPRKFYISFPNITITYHGDVSNTTALGVLNSFIIQPTRTAPLFISGTPTPNTVSCTIYSKAIARFKTTTAQTTGIITKSYLQYQANTFNKYWTNLAPGYFNTGSYQGFGFPVIGLYKNEVNLYFTSITGNKYINIGYDWWDATTQTWTLGKIVQTVVTPQISTGYYLTASFYTTCKINGSSNTGTADSLRIYVLTEVSESLTSAYVISSFVDDTSIDILN